jgi:hypothetical protein
VDNATLGSLVMAGLSTELSYMSPEAEVEALFLEAELLADAAAGVDLRIRLIGAACSPMVTL